MGHVGTGVQPLRSGTSMVGICLYRHLGLIEFNPIIIEKEAPRSNSYDCIGLYVVLKSRPSSSDFDFFVHK